MPVRAPTPPDAVAEIRRLHLAGTSRGDIAAAVGVSSTVVRKHVGDLPQDLHEYEGTGGPGGQSARAMSAYREARRLQAREWFRDGERVDCIAWALGVKVGFVQKSVAGVVRFDPPKPRVLIRPAGEWRRYPHPDRALSTREVERIRELHAEGEPTKVLGYRFGVREALIVAALRAEAA